MVQKTQISIVCPVFNEEAVLDLFYERLAPVLDSLKQKYSFEILFTNNASTDRTLERLLALRQRDPRIQVLTFSRNFGYQPSLVAGIRHAKGEAILIIDADCQDPPEMLPIFLSEWQKGFDLVHGIRRKRMENWIIGLGRKIYYRLVHSIADYEFIIDMGDFALFSKRIKEAVLSNRSTYPFLRTDLGFVGFRTKGIPYKREKRIAGESHFNPWKMAQFAWGGMLSSTTFFLRVGVYLGFPLGVLNLVLCALAAFGMGNQFLPSLFALDAAYIVTGLAFISTYIARIYKDGIQRPLFIIDWEKSTLRETTSVSAPLPLSPEGTISRTPVLEH